MEAIRAMKRRLSIKDKNANFDDHDSADEETTEHLNGEIDSADKDGHDYGKPGSLLNRLIMHGNKKTEEQLAQEHAAANSQTTSTKS